MAAMAHGSAVMVEKIMMPIPSIIRKIPSIRMRPFTPNFFPARSPKMPPRARAKRFIIPKRPAMIPASFSPRLKLSTK
jgi:hypothetical protein